MQNHWLRNLVIFLGAQTISLMGTSMVQYAIMWHVTLETQSGVMMTIYIICGFLPTFFLSPFAGVWADRYNRKTMIMLSDSFVALATLILALLFLGGFSSIWILFVFVVLRAIGSGIQTPAIGAILPQIVPENKLTQANACNATIQSFISLISPMASAALLSVTTIERIFFIDVATALIAVLTLLLFLQVAPRRHAGDVRGASYFADLRDGLRYIASQDYLKRFFLFVALFLFLAAPASFLTPLQVARSFGGDEWRLMAIEVAFSVGMMAGGGVLAAWGGFRNRIHTMTLATVLFGLMTLLFGVLPNFWLYLAAMGLAGISIPFFNTPAHVLLQEKIRPEFLGRVYGVMSMIANSVTPVAMLVFGPVADMVKIEGILIATGVLLFALSFMLVGSRSLVEAGKSKASRAPAASSPSSDEP